MALGGSRTSPAGAANQTLQVLRRPGGSLSRCLLIRLPPSFISRFELIFLLAHDVTALIHPLGSLISSIAGASLHIITSFLGPSPERFTRLAARLRRVQQSHRSPNP